VKNVTDGNGRLECKNADEITGGINMALYKFVLFQLTTSRFLELIYFVRLS
jgi:hypothetical protein